MTKERTNFSPDITEVEIKQQEQDFISKLPDALLLPILSLLSESEATRTRILSNRWNLLPALLPTLRFDLSTLFQSIEECNKFHDFVDRTLVLRGDIPIERFSLHCSKLCDYNRVYDWLCIVVQSKVEQLDLNFSADRNKVKLCWDLFKTCNTLVALTLKGEFKLDVPEAQLIFPCLKKLNLVSVVYSGEKALVNLISGSPVLEELFVERKAYGDGLQMFPIFSHSLKRLRMLFTDNSLEGVISCIPSCATVIDVPNMEYLKIEDRMSQVYAIMKMPSLVEAYMDTSGYATELFTRLSSAITLTLTCPTIHAALSVDDIDMCRFPNLVKLEIDISRGMHWDLLLLSFLNNMPNLERITFLNGLLLAQDNETISWNPPEEAPACLRFKMKEMIILNREVVTQDEFPLISYLLKNSSVLESFRINALDIDPERREQLLNFHRGSNLCQIEFV